MSDSVILENSADLKIASFIRIARAAVARAQAESRKLGVPNVYSIDGRIQYEIPSGELSAIDPGETVPQ